MGVISVRFSIFTLSIYHAKIIDFQNLMDTIEMAITSMDDDDKLDKLAIRWTCSIQCIHIAWHISNVWHLWIVRWIHLMYYSRVFCFFFFFPTSDRKTVVEHYFIITHIQTANKRWTILARYAMESGKNSKHSTCSTTATPITLMGRFKESTVLN